MILMQNCRQQTVSVAITRRMAPSAHILAYFIDYTGELVADIIHFHVNITSDTVALNLTINQRKDLTGDTVELLAYGPPQARVAFAGTEYAQYHLYGGNDILEIDVRNVLSWRSYFFLICCRFTMNCSNTMLLLNQVRI